MTPRRQPGTRNACRLAVLALAALFAPSARPAAAAAAPDLRACADPALQAGLEREIARLGLSPVIKNRHLAVALVDLSAEGAPHLAMLNGDEMMYAASLPKIVILLGAFVQAKPLLDILTSPRYRFYDPATGGGLWVGKAYGKASAYRRDPLEGLSHGATAFQVACFVGPVPSDPAAPGR